MFVTYLGRELRRRARQASIIAIGLALGIGLVITVTALCSAVRNRQLAPDDLAGARPPCAPAQG
jgi:hypothetical protein